ncbi:hypothetical protein ACNHE5_08635 [Pandoraea pnomenusa]|uniref:hypothetical protein n=1 Tax=Pandoraea pnomenusa TaxID=93220 RepID=UPI0003C763FB|nr:hypothetical protein U875_14075 [Pandoraea pnomenusa 3kgm]
MPFKMPVDRLDDVLKSIADLVNEEVLVGIPASTAERKDGEAGPINNAEIGYVQENGSAANNVPARPFLVPGVKGVQDRSAKELGDAAGLALDGKRSLAIQKMDRVGMLAASAVKAKIGSNIPPPLKPGTIRERARQRGTATRRKGEQAYLDMVDAGAQAAGMSLAEIQSAAGIVPLINTGQLRNAITFVRRKKKR